MLIGYASFADFGGLTMCISLFAGTVGNASARRLDAPEARVEELPGAFRTAANLMWFLTAYATST